MDKQWTIGMIWLTLVITNSLHVSAVLKSNPEHSYQTTVNKSGFISFLNNKLSLTSSPPYDYISYIDIHKDTFIKRFNPQTELSLLDGNWINLTKTKISSFNSKGYKFRVGDIFKRNNAIYTLVELTSIIKKQTEWW